MNRDGTAQTHLVDGFQPYGWSSDGKRIYAGAQGLGARIVSFLADGTDVVFLSEGAPDYAADASPWLFVDGFESGNASAWN